MFTIHCSVRTLVEFVYLCGDIDRHFQDAQRALDGAKIHRKLQKESDLPYEAEVFLKHKTELDEICFLVEGRADGIIHRENEIIIDEIKTTYAPFESIVEDFNDVHWAQAMCYGYFYAYDHALDHIIIQLTYYQMEDHRIKRFEKRLPFDQLETFYLDVLKQYEKWALLAKQHKNIRQQSIKAMEFPFSAYRKGQRDLAIATYKNILDHKVLFAQAPTGIGKTMSVLFPAIKSLGENKADRVFYLSAKTMTQKVAVDALSKMRDQGLQLKSVVISAKEKCCLMEEKNCDPNVCPYAKGYYDRLHDTMYELLTTMDHFEIGVLKQVGMRDTLCPFELSLDLSLYCDVIICDYNYVFDPQVYLKRFFQENKERLVLLVDEAHNLVDRARSMFTKQLTLTQAKEGRSALPKEEKRLRKVVNQLIKHFNQFEEELKEKTFMTMESVDPQFCQYCEMILELGERYLKEHTLANDDAFETLYFEVSHFLRMLELADDHFTITLQKAEDDIIYELYCLDPSSLLKSRMNEVSATCLFSATLSPVTYFEMLLTGNKENRKLMLSSPFPKEHLHISIHNGISTRYKDRLQSAKAICELIFSAVSMKQGNYMVFVPSYQYLRLLYDTFHQMYPHIKLIAQESGMNEDAKKAFLDHFTEPQTETLIGFCVLGGMYGEGIDLRDDMLIGSIIVGVGLPQINEHQELLKAYFEEIHQGFAYAYICPGMSKVLQACGRVIRSENDKGMILLIDDRYTMPAWNNLLPPHYQHYHLVRSPYALMKQLRSFWKNNAEK